MRLLFVLIFLTGLLLFSCAETPEIELKVVDASQSSDYQILTYSVEAKTTNKNCSVKQLEFEAEIHIHSSSPIEPDENIMITEEFGEVPKRKKMFKTFTYNTEGRIATPNNEIRIVESGFEKGKCEE